MLSKDLALCLTFFQRFQGTLQTESIKLTIKLRLRNHLGQKVIKWKICILCIRFITFGKVSCKPSNLVILILYLFFAVFWGSPLRRKYYADVVSLPGFFTSVPSANSVQFQKVERTEAHGLLSFPLILVLISKSQRFNLIFSL